MTWSATDEPWRQGRPAVPHLARRSVRGRRGGRAGSDGLCRGLSAARTRRQSRGGWRSPQAGSGASDLARAIQADLLSDADLLADTPFPRLTGSFRFDWPRSDIAVILDCDEYRVRPVGASWVWANSVDLLLPVGRWTAEVAEAATALFTSLVDRLEPAYAAASTAEEWQDRLLVFSEDAVRARGGGIFVDPPSIFWITFLRVPPPRSSDPASLGSATLRPFGRGTLIETHTSPLEWRNRRALAARIERVLCESALSRGSPNCSFAGMVGISRSDLPGRARGDGRGRPGA